MTFQDLIMENGPPDAVHTPAIAFDGMGSGKPGMVSVMVGNGDFHPSSSDHHIAWIELYGVKKKDRKVVKLKRVARGQNGFSQRVRIRVRGSSQFASFCALAYCNVHGLWTNVREA